jgi:sporulation protein YlmC with PRC-barrel domain
MIRTLLASTALATLVATAAYAQQDPAPAAAPAPAETTQPAAPSVDQPMTKADGYLATNMIGESVYNGTGDNAENIGDVNDIVIGNEGAVKAVVIGVGGFLGIGEKSVAIDMGKLDWAEANGDRWLVTNVSKEQLEALPAFDRTPYDPAPAPVASNDPLTPASPAPSDGTAVAPAPAEPAVAANPVPADQPAATDSAAAPATDSAAPATDATTTAAIDKTTLTEIPSGELKAEELIGTKVYGANDEHIGEISDIILSQDGKVDSFVLDVGGFLGMGEKPVAIGFDKLAFMTDKDGNKYLYTKFTKEQLEAQPAYDKGTYTEKRDDQRLIVQ